MATRRKRTPEQFGVWPSYSPACRRDVQALLAQGGGLSAYRSNPDGFPVGPREGSWAWKVEQEAARLHKVKHAIAVNSGTMALFAALIGAKRAGRIKAEGEVIVPPFSFSATVAAVIHAGYTPVFADVDSATGIMDPASAQRMVSRETAAILPVDLFGRLAVYGYGHDAFTGIGLGDLGIPVIQDACQAVGAFRGGKHLFGLAAAWSFNGSKNVPAGEAGCLGTNDDDIAKYARLLVSHGENFGDSEVGMNGRLNEITACVAWHGLAAVEERNSRRRALSNALWNALKDFDEIAALPEPINEDHALYVWPLILVREAARAAFCAKLRELGIEVGEGYLQPTLDQYRAFQGFRKDGELPKVHELSEKTLCLFTQVRPPATMEDMDYLGEAIRWALGRGAKPGRKQIGQGRVSDF